MYEINYTMFFICSILLGKIQKIENSVIQLIPKSLRDVTVSVMEEIVEAGREHFSANLINLVDSLVKDDKGVFYILDNYQEMKDVHGEIVDEVITQASRFCCQYYRSNQAVLDEVIGKESIQAVKACAVGENSTIQDHINFIRVFSAASMCVVVAGDLDVISKLGAQLMQNKDQQTEKKETVQQTETAETVTATAEAVAAAQAGMDDVQGNTVDGTAKTVSETEEGAGVITNDEPAEQPTLMMGSVNLLDPAGILSKARAAQALKREREEEENRLLAEAKEKRKQARGPWYKLGAGKAAKEARQKTDTEVKEAMDSLHAKWRAEDEARASA